MDPFEMLGVARRFDLDLGAVEKVHRELSRALHPDKHVQASASERRAVLDKAASVNEAWRIVRDPIRRAESLFDLSGIAVGENNEPKASAAFLMDVLEMREALAEARAHKDVAKVEALAGDVRGRAKKAEAALATGFAATSARPDRAALEKLLPSLGELRFYRRFLDEVSAFEEEQDA
ncbi:MAG: Fe-S protein assembly co-chaperone HscB [Labilithrix sp.]|nr:Fe-S protein assembly co-chaperone HscB [Labilithrix sp.]